ncbi:winged helix-turn-helix transcriptional regulator [Candidatus Woesearchaeota archaeon]|nr:winged helix-turn-helix transcriptional regulator [Candidatus Woesearchaeota archaeon]
MWEEEKVVLDQKTFKALAAETRVSILKTLNKRRHTQTELSAVLNMSVPTVKEHLDAMEKAGLVKMADEGRKWKYYDLTEVSRCILEPDRKRLWITLGITGLAVVAGAAGIGRQLMSPLLAPKQFEVAPLVQKAAETAAQQAADAAHAVAAPAMAPLAERAAEAAVDVVQNQTVASQAPHLAQSVQWRPGLGFYIYLSILVVLLGLCVYFYIRARKQRKVCERFLR